MSKVVKINYLKGLVMFRVINKNINYGKLFLAVEQVFLEEIHFL